MVMMINPKRVTVIMNIIKGQLPSFPLTVPGSSMCVRLIQIDWGRVKGSSWVGPNPKANNKIEQNKINEMENKVNPRIIWEVPFEIKLSNLYFSLAVKEVLGIVEVLVLMEDDIEQVKIVIISSGIEKALPLIGSPFLKTKDGMRMVLVKPEGFKGF